MTDDKDLFSADLEPDTNDPGLFSDVGDPDKDYVSELVGEGKKYKDNNALAKKAIHADQHILKIESENAQLRQKLKESLSLEEFYEKVKTSTPSPSTPSPQQQDEPDRNQVSIEQLDSLVGKRLQEHLTSEQQKNNLAYVMNEVEKKLGPNFGKLMKDRAREVGETEDDLRNLARNKPKLFLELMVPHVPQTNFPGLPRTQMDSSKMGNNQGVVRNKSFYDQLRRTDRKAYDSRDTQIQMHKDAIALGEKFFQ